jgi:hypothetical protein
MSYGGAGLCMYSPATGKGGIAQDFFHHAVTTLLSWSRWSLIIIIIIIILFIFLKRFLNFCAPFLKQAINQSINQLIN